MPLADDPRVWLHLSANSAGFDALTTSSEHCGGCGRKMAFTKSGRRRQHRTRPDSLVAPYCKGDTAW